MAATRRPSKQSKMIVQDKCRMLTTLPNEILLVVFSHLDDPYPLYPLSTLCRRLHFLALPIYLSRTGVLQWDTSTESCSVAIGIGQTDILAALNTSLFLRKVHNITCAFPELQSQLKDLRRFRRFCSMLESIESANLLFSRPSFAAFDYRIHEMFFHDTLVQVLNVVLEKSCTSLTVDTISSDRVSKRNRAAAPTWGAPIRSIPLSSAAIRKRQLSVFRIHSDVLLSPYCRGWTIDVLNSFALTALSIDVQYVATEIWASLLSDTEIPTLSNLSMNHCTIKPAHMHAFLSRHPSVTSLQLGNVPTPSPQERLPPDHLPRLHTLSAPAAQVAYLLHALEHTDTLQNVRVLSHMTRLDLTLIDASLRPVAPRLAPLSCLSVVLPVYADLPSLPADLNLRLTDDAALRYVSALELVFEEINSSFFRLADYVSVTIWFTPFPALRAVVLVGFNESYNLDLMIEAMRTRAPRIEMLTVNGVEHSLQALDVL